LAPLRGSGSPPYRVIRVLRARNPDFLAADDVLVTVPRGHRLELRGVRAGRRLGDAERLQPQLAGRDLRQERALLRIGSMPQQRAHRVHLRVARAGIPAAAIDFLEDDRRLRDAEAGPAVRFGNQRREVAGVGERFDERAGIRTRRVELPPVAVGKCPAQVANGVPQILMELDGRHGVIIVHVLKRRAESREGMLAWRRHQV